jgi:hypothetical protein
MKNRWLIFLLCWPLAVIWAQTGVVTQNGGSASYSGQTYAATQTDQSTIYALNSGALTLVDCIMTKTGDASDVNQSSQYGTNAGVLAASHGTVVIVGGSVTTTASGGNGLFATGSGSAISMSNGAISAVGGGAHGVDATYGGSVTLNQVDVYTDGSNSSALATDFGGGTVTVTGGTITSACTIAGSHSAGVYSTGTITVQDAVISSAADCGGVIDGANAIHLTNCTVTAALQGFKTWKTAPATGSATITISGGAVTSATGPIFYVDGETGNPANANITISDDATLCSGDGCLISVTEGSTAALTLSNLDCQGYIYASDNSSLTVTLQNNANLSAITENAAITLSGGSIWSLDGISHLTTLTGAEISGNAVSNITGNNWNVFYDPDLTGNAYLNGQTYSLVNGGYLAPEGTVAVDQPDGVAPGTGYAMSCAPNPFNPETRISYSLPAAGHVFLDVYDLKGRRINRILEQNLGAGTFSAVWNGRNETGRLCGSGVYLCRMTVDGRHVGMQRLTLLK